MFIQEGGLIIIYVSLLFILSIPSLKSIVHTARVCMCAWGRVFHPGGGVVNEFRLRTRRLMNTMN